MGKTVRELELSMGSQEFTHWVAMDEIDPIGNQKSENLLGLIGTMLCNAFSKKRTDFNKFMPDYETSAKRSMGLVDKQSSSDIKSKMSAIMDRQNKSLRKKKKRR